MSRSSRLFDSTGEAIGKDHKITGGLSAGHRLEDDVVTALRSGRTIPGAVEGNERSRTVGSREFAVGDEQQVIGCPMRGEESGGRCSLRAQANRFAAISAVFRREYQLLLEAVEIAFRPTEVRATLHLHRSEERRVGEERTSV